MEAFHETDWIDPCAVTCHVESGLWRGFRTIWSRGPEPHAIAVTNDCKCLLQKPDHYFGYDQLDNKCARVVAGPIRNH
jgi:hypothetical protein